MSIKVMNWVWEHSRSTGNDRLVLLAIADTAHDDGTNAYPKSATIQRKCGGISERTVTRCIERLVEMNELYVEQFGQGRTPSKYRVLMIEDREAGVDILTTPKGRQSDHPAPSECPPRVDTADYPGQTECPPGVDTGVYPLREPSVNQEPEPTSGRADARTDEEKTPKANPRGQRLPENWLPTLQDITWQREQGISDQFAQAETEKFKDHFLASAQATARKLDWSRAWKNWIRTATERRGGSHAPEPVSTERRPTW